MARISVEQHRRDVAELLAAFAGPRPPEEVPLDRALDRVLAADVHAPVDLPLFRNSQMDGFAVHAADVAGAAPGAPVRLPVVAEVPAGPGAPDPLARGSAARIMTGAPVPEGADAVVPVEDTDAGTFGRRAAADRADGAALRADGAIVEVRVARAPGDFVREAGSDVRSGDVLLRSGNRIGPSQVAAAAACGVALLPVVGRPRVAVVSTGTELVAPGDRPGPGEVYDANLVALAAAVRRAGGEVTSTARVGDDVGHLGAVLAAAAGAADLILTSGGVSQGAYEVVKDVLQGEGSAEGSTVTFRSVAMQPGGPQGLGTVHGTPILTFPGNPVSAQVSFVVFARDLLRRAGGLPPFGERLERRVLDGPVTSPDGRRQMLRGVRGPDGAVAVVGGAGSHLVASMARADVLIDIPAEVTSLAAGDEVEVWEL